MNYSFFNVRNFFIASILLQCAINKGMDDNKDFSSMDKTERFDDLTTRINALKERQQQKKYIHESDVKQLILDAKSLRNENNKTVLGQGQNNIMTELVERIQLKKDISSLESFLLATQLNPVHQIEKLYKKIKK